MKSDFYSIGQLAAICNVSDQTLRFYDKINLLKPSKVDENNGYRYYSDTDILKLRIICDLKKIGLSLEEINDYLINDNSHYTINLLEKKRQEYSDMLSSVNSVLERINNRIERLSFHETAAGSINEFSKTIEIKQIPQRVVAYTRYRSNCYHEALAKRFFELDNLVKMHNMQASDSRLAIYHDFLKNFNPEDCDLEICIPVDNQFANQGCVRSIPAGLYATGIYKGNCQGYCDYLVTWLNNHGYEIIGPGIEIYINSFENTRFSKNFVTEVQFLVKKC